MNLLHLNPNVHNFTSLSLRQRDKTGQFPPVFSLFLPFVLKSFISSLSSISTISTLCFPIPFSPHILSWLCSLTFCSPLRTLWWCPVQSANFTHGWCSGCIICTNLTDTQRQNLQEGEETLSVNTHTVLHFRSRGGDGVNIGLIKN